MSKEEPRWWVNEQGPKLTGTVNYKGSRLYGKDMELVGIVDELAGGMVAYAPFDEAEAIVRDLNAVDEVRDIVAP